MDLAKIVAKICGMHQKSREYRASRICWEVMGGQATFEGLPESAQELMRSGAFTKMESAEGGVRESYKFDTEEERQQRKERLAALSRAKSKPSVVQEILKIRGGGFFDTVFLAGRPIGDFNAADFKTAYAKAKMEIAGKERSMEYYQWAEDKCAKSGKIFRESVSAKEALKMYRKCLPC